MDTGEVGGFVLSFLLIICVTLDKFTNISGLL